MYQHIRQQMSVTLLFSIFNTIRQLIFFLIGSWYFFTDIGVERTNFFLRNWLIALTDLITGFTTVLDLQTLCGLPVTLERKNKKMSSPIKLSSVLSRPCTLIFAEHSGVLQV